MKGLGNLVDLHLLVRFALAAGTPRRLASVLLGILVYLLVPSREIMAASRAIVYLSPLVAQSTLVAPTDPPKGLNVIIVLALKAEKAARRPAARRHEPARQLSGEFVAPDRYA